MTPDMDIAARWLDALRVRDKGMLSESTQYPFEWLDTGRQSCSAKQPAVGPEELSPILDCLLADPILRAALAEHDRAGIAELPLARLQKWALPSRDRAPVGATLVNVFIKQGDIQLDMDLWITRGAVQELWTDVVDGSSAVSIAKRWLDALRRRDLVVEAAGEDYSIPNWAEHWWHASKHGGLDKISAGASNPVSYSFDLILMTAPDGVRAFWKLGSLPAEAFSWISSTIDELNVTAATAMHCRRNHRAKARSAICGTGAANHPGH